MTSQKRKFTEMADLQAEIDSAVAAVSKQGEVVRSLKAAVKSGEAEKVRFPTQIRTDFFNTWSVGVSKYKAGFCIRSGSHLSRHY